MSRRAGCHRYEVLAGNGQGWPSHPQGGFNFPGVGVGVVFIRDGAGGDVNSVNESGEPRPIRADCRVPGVPLALRILPGESVEVVNGVNYEQGGV